MAKYLKWMLFPKKFGTFNSWIASYFFILLIPILISSFVYIQTIEIIKKDINENRLAMLMQVQQIMDSQMEDIKRLSLHIALNPYIQGLLYAENPINEYNTYTLTKALQDFRTYKTANSFVTDFYVYFINIDTVLTTSALYEPQLAYKTYHRYEGMTYDKWLNIVSGNYIKEFMPLSLVETPSNTTKTIAYIQSLPMDKSSKNVATEVILLDEKRFQESINNIGQVDENEITVILDKNNNILASTHKFDFGNSLEYDKFSNEQGLIYKKIDGKMVVISYLTSNVTDWKYISIIPMGVFLEKVDYIRNIIIVSILLCLLMGGIMSYLFTKRNFNPIKELINLVTKKSEIRVNKSFNEINYIKEAIENTINEKHKTEIELKQQNLALRGFFLAQLMKGEIENYRKIDEQLSLYNMHFNSDNFAVMIFSIEDFKKFFGDSEKYNIVERRKIVKFLITNIVEEMYNYVFQVFATDYNDMLAYLVCSKKLEVQNNKEEMIRIAYNLQQYLLNNLNISVSISLSPFCKGITEVPFCLSQALEAMDYKMIKGYEQLIHYDEIKDLQRSFYYSSETEQKLKNLIKAGNFEESKTLLYEIFDKNFTKEVLSITMVKCFIFDLICTIIKIIDEADIEELYDEKHKVIEVLLNCNMVMEVKDEIINCVKQICISTTARKKSHNVTIVQDIVDYINEKYNDDNFGIAKIAEYFEMNSAYIARLFKEQTGEGLMDYINRIRIKKAKELLKDKEMKIIEIAKEVGYYDSRAIIRAFKKYEGITPGQYKEIV